MCFVTLPNNPKGLGVRQPSGAFDDMHDPKRRRAAAVQDASAVPKVLIW